MSIYELAERDLRKAENSLAMAKKRPNVPAAELEHIENLCRLRKEILEIIRSGHNERSEGEWIEHEDDWCGTFYTCSACGCDWTTIDGTPQENNMRYCPECGAKMKGGAK